ncbi:gag polyprotein, partial [Scomber scombrus]
MSQAGSPGAGNQTPAELGGLIAKQAFDLAELQQELKKAFPTVQSRIAVLENASRSTVGSVASLSMQVSAISGALADIQKSLDTLTAQTPVSGLPDPVANTSPSPPSVAAGSAASPVQAHPQSEPNLVSPRPFDGDFNRCRGFLAQCGLLFTHQPSRYSSDGSRIALVMSLLVDEALSWAIAAVEGNLSLATDYAQFKREFQAVFDHPVDGKDAASRLLGLSDAIKDLIVRDCPETLNDLISLALQMDSRLQERRTDRVHRSSPRQPSHRPATE